MKTDEAERERPGQEEAGGRPTELENTASGTDAGPGPDAATFGDAAAEASAGAPGEGTGEDGSEDGAADRAGYRITPMFAQYLSVKENYPDALLFYRMGDFYELFFEDAVTTARELQLALTARNKNNPNSVPMCGVPWHSLDNYTPQLLEKGYNIVICDQVEDPKEAKGLVKREVTRILTPGTTIEDVNLEAGRHNFLGSMCVDGDAAAFVWADISTGQWSGLECRASAVWQQALKFSPSELIVQEGMEPPADSGASELRLVRRGRAAFDAKRCEERLLAAQGVRDLGALGMRADSPLPRAAGALLGYLEQTHKRRPDHLLPFRPLDPGRHLVVDEVTQRNLEVFVRLNGARGKGTLRHVMDGTRTPMGARLLEDVLREPLRDVAALNREQDAVECLLRARAVRRDLRAALDGIFDLERLSTRIHFNRALPKDFVALRQTLRSVPAVRGALESLHGASDSLGAAVPVPEVVEDLLRGWDDLADLRDLLDRALADTPPALLTEGGIFKRGYDEELDRLLDFSEHGERLLKERLEADQARVGSVRLKLGSNRVFGYYYEVSRLQASQGSLPEDFVRRQTLANAERYTTPELKELEEKIVGAGESRAGLEYRLFQALRDRVAGERPRVTALSRVLARVDHWQGLAEMADVHGWTRPTLVEEPVLRVQEGRHPVVEETLGRANFVPNSFTLDETRRLCLLTGPNMAGKSTVLRQMALICLMAQTGSFVPAQSATIGVVDRLFSRVGASDNLAQGQSTFMVEMMETARILRQCTRHSLVILDEIGRGTSTYDGLALAWAVAEDLAQRHGGSVRTLFATHYHELTRLEGQIPGVFTMNIAIREHNRTILFLHRLIPGPADKSYGIEVARLAGVPMPVVNRAQELLARFEKLRETSREAVARAVSGTLLPGLEPPAEKENAGRVKASPEVAPEPPREHPLERILKDLDPQTLTPLAALNLVCEWKSLFGGPEKDTDEAGDVPPDTAEDATSQRP